MIFAFLEEYLLKIEDLRDLHIKNAIKNQREACFFKNLTTFEEKLEKHFIVVLFLSLLSQKKFHCDHFIQQN